MQRCIKVEYGTATSAASTCLLAKHLRPELLAHKLDDLQRLAQARTVGSVALSKLPSCPEAYARSARHISAVLHGQSALA